MRDWVVALHARSTIRLKGEEVLEIKATPASTIPLKALRLRNAYSKVYGKLIVTGLIAEGLGQAEDAGAAVEFLAPLAAPFLQVAATAANGSVDETDRLLVYAPATDHEVGRFLEQRPCSPQLPAATIRSVGAADLLPFVLNLKDHPEEERIHRAMAHYRQGPPPDGIRSRAP
jgi:hypothetical protein